MKQDPFFKRMPGAALALVFVLAFALTALGCGPEPGAEYTVSFDAVGGTVTPGSITVGSGKTVVVLPTPTREGHVFGGWHTQPDGGGTAFTTATPVAGDITVYAKWTVDSQTPAVHYTVTFNANGGAVSPASITVESGKTVVVLPTPTWKGYDFGGWHTQPNGGGTAFTTATPVAADITVHAKWTPEVQITRHTVTFNANGGAVSPASITVESGKTVAVLPTPTWKGYDFGGWHTQPDGGGTAFTTATPVAGDITVYAKWTPDGQTPAVHYTVTFNAAGGTVNPASITVESGKTVVVLPTPTWMGYDFGGWHTQPNGGGTAFTTATIVAANITVYAKWTPDSQTPAVHYTVTFNAAGGTVSPASITVESGNTVSALPTPTWEDYDFGGWHTQPNGGGTAFTTATPVAANMTVYAKWTADVQYTVSFNANGGTVSPASATVASGDTVSALPTPTREGYVFGGWHTQPSGGGTPFATTTVVVFDITVYAKWTPDIQYTVSFDADGGTVAPANTTVLSGGTASVLPTPNKADYAFSGWYTAKNGLGTAFTTATVVAANITVYAKWTTIVVTGVVVSPGSASVIRGQSRAFTATVQGAGSPSQAVTWTVEGGAPGTAITNGGILTVGANETASSLTVRATSAYDPSKSGAATVTIPAPGAGTITLIYPEEGDVAYDAFLDVPITLSKSNTGGNFDTHTLTVNGEYDSYRWRVDGTVKANSKSIDLYAADYAVGPHQINVEVARRGAAYSKAGTFTVEN